MVKKSASSYANEESFQIKNGNTVLQTSPTFSNSETRTIEYCLTATTNSQYTLLLKDSYGDSWSSGSWVTAQGEYGNYVFKNYLTAAREESYTLSLYYAIKKTQSWKFTSGLTTIDNSWYTAGFNDGAWQTVTLGSVSVATTGTQYFRKTFVGIANMAAYELQMNYRYGIVAYVNGVEVFREYVPDGVLTPATASTGAYSSLTYHGIIRPASEAANANSILAIELHFPGSQTTVDFDAYMAMVASSVVDGTCFIYAASTTLTGSGVTSVSNMFDFVKWGSASVTAANLPKTVTYQFKGPRPFINGIRVFPYTSPGNAPSNFKWEGSMTSTGTYTSIMNVVGAEYTSNTYELFRGYFNAKGYSNYRLTLNSAVDAGTLNAYEIQPLICPDTVPTGIHFKKSSYSFYANYEEANIHPMESDFSGCTVEPALPAGMSIDASTCLISGTPTTPQSSTPYTVRAVVNGNTYTGTVSIQVMSCSGVVAKIVRSYKTNPTSERFTITEDASQQAVLTVTSGQIASSTVTHVLCLTGTKYTVNVASTSNYWASGSYLYVRLMLSGSEYESVLRVRFDSNLALNTVYHFNGQFNVAPQSQWFYKMNEVPANWHSSETSGWNTGSIGSFTGATNQIQLYKKTFTVSSLNEVAGFVISLRYIYSCVIYMNGVEVFRNGVSGDVSTSSSGTNAYTDIMYRQISLPAKTMGIGDTASVNYLQEGTNTIAIAIVAQTASQTTSYFDCAVRLMGAAEVSRVFDYTVTYSKISGSPSSCMNHYYSHTLYYSSCADNYLSITFPNDRREWVSSLLIMLYYTQNTQQMTQFVLKARNNNLEEWTTLKTVSGLAWSLTGQQKKVWIENNKPWNQYRFENFASGDPNACYWKFSNIDLRADAIGATIPELTYTPNVEVYRNIEMGEVYANANYYYDFTVTPDLPAGIKLDAATGTICGTATTTVSPQSYVIRAKKVNGGETTATINLSVSICTGGKSLISLVARTDSYPKQSSYKLYRGKGTTGEVVSSVEYFRGSASLNYGDFCVPHDIYTLELLDSASNGWTNPAGYYLTIDLGEMIFEMGQVPPNVPSVSTMFSSLLPFQIEYDDWKVWNRADEADSNWKSVDFDDSTWETRKASEFGDHMGTTAYVRREVNIPSIDDYHVLNVRMKYAGGIAAYFNGRLVARFNLPETFTAETQATELHDASLFSKFHIVLPTVGAVTGKNVFAVEIHRSTQSGVVFDATGVFGVNECSIVVDSFPTIEGSSVTTTNLEGLMDLNPVTYGYQSNRVGTHIRWTVENLEGSKFNSFAMQTVYARTSYGFSVYVRYNAEEEWTSALALLDQSTKERARSSWPIPLAIAGFNDFKFTVDDTASSIVYVSSYIMEYCHRSGAGMCQAVGDFPAVAEGEISPSSCEEGFRGYAYRECTNGQFSDIKTDKCEYKLPDNLRYKKQLYAFVVNTESSTEEPEYSNRITEFYMQEDTPLPDGIKIDSTTGVISGVPTSTFAARSFTVRGKNPKGETFTVINISARKGYCAPDGVFERTDVGKVAEYDCAMKGSYVGTQKRACILGKKDGEWQKATGFCMPIAVIVIFVLIVIAVIVVVVMLIMRTTKSKTVGGAKARTAKSSKSNKSKASVKKTTSKSVKV